MLQAQYFVVNHEGEWKIKFQGTAGDNEYQFELDAGVKYELPAWKDRDDPISERFVCNSNGSIDFAMPPATLQENRNGSGVKSIGHGNGLMKPIRIQVGSQNRDDEHSGSGLIHIMFAHDKTDIHGIEQLLWEILRPEKIGAIYKTKDLDVDGFYRYFFLNRATSPYRLVTQLREGYHRLLTVFKPDGSQYNKFANKPNDYSRIYSWDKDKY